MNFSSYSGLEVMISDLSVFLELIALGGSFVYIFYTLCSESISDLLLELPESSFSSNVSVGRVISSFKVRPSRANLKMNLRRRKNKQLVYKVSSYRGSSLSKQNFL